MAQVVNLRGVLRGLRRRRQIVLGFFLIAVIGAGLFVVVSPTTYVAKASVVLPPSPIDAQGNQTRNIATEVQIVEGSGVLGPAAQTVQPAITLSALRQAISVRGVTSQVLQISVHSGNASRAAQLANAVATSYVAYADDTATDQSNATAAAYAQEVGQLNQQVQSLDQQISTGTAALAGLSSAEAQQREAAIDSLRSDELTLAEDLNQDQTQIADAQLQAQLNRQGTQVLQPALVPSSPASPQPLLDVAAAALAGLLLGGIVALALENGDHRLRTRDAISAATDAPVLASLQVKDLARGEQGQDFVDQWEPTVVETYALVQASTRLAGGAPMENLVIVALDGDPAAEVLTFELAVFATLGGAETSLVFASRDDAGAALRSACDAIAPDGQGLRSGLTVFGAGAALDLDQLDDADLIFTLVVADAGPIVLPTWDRPTRVALAVSAGRFTADALEAVAAACLDQGMSLSGIFVANPDPTDRSSGQRSAVPATEIGHDVDVTVSVRPGQPAMNGDRRSVDNRITSQSWPNGSDLGRASETERSGG